MKLIISAPKKEMELYLEEVLRQFKDGYTSGLVRPGVYWNAK